MGTEAGCAEKITRGRSIFPQVLIQPRRHLFTSLRRACLHARDAQCVWSHESSISSSWFPLKLRRAISHESGLRKLQCSRLLRASCSLQAAARKCSVQVALCKLLCASWSVQVALRQLLRASALRMCSVQVALRKCSEQVALRTCSAPVAPRKRFAHVLCARWSVQVALRKRFVQLLCATRRAQVALRK